MISAIVLAAGLSRRMGSFKLLLPWRQRTVIGQVVWTLEAAGIADILVVTGHQAAEVAETLAGTPARCVFNPAFAEGEMLSSIQAGLTALMAATADGEEYAATLVCLGDQPQIEAATVKAVIQAGAASGWTRCIVPSYQMHAGHPILLPRFLWPAVLASQTDLRAVLTANRYRTAYVSVASPSILADLDTPEDYARAVA